MFKLLTIISIVGIIYFIFSIYTSIKDSSTRYIQKVEWFNQGNYLYCSIDKTEKRAKINSTEWKLSNNGEIFISLKDNQFFKFYECEELK